MKLLIRHHYIIKPDEYMVYTWYFSCQISGTVNDRSRQNIERKKQLHEVSEMRENHMVNTWKFCEIYTYCIILNTHIYIYIVYNSIYIYIHIFFKHIHIIDVDYRDIALRYVTLNCEKKGDMAVTQTIQM